MLYVAPGYGAIGKTRPDFDPAYAALRTVRPVAFFADFFGVFFSTARLTAALRAEAEPSVAAPLPPCDQACTKRIHDIDPRACGAGRSPDCDFLAFDFLLNCAQCGL